MFSVAFVFPLLFGFPNVDVWDNLHKFAIITMYAGTIIVVAFYTDTTLTKKQVQLFLAFCVIVSSTTLIDIAKHRLSADFVHQVMPVARVADIVEHLRGAHKIIVPYKMDPWGTCEADKYAGVADHSGNFVKDSYYTNFLLAPAIEDQYNQDLTWIDATSTILQKIETLDSNSIMVIDRKHEKEFLQIYSQFTPPNNRHLVYFDHFMLYE
jgi:hypothetical protein